MITTNNAEHILLVSSCYCSKRQSAAQNM